MNENKNKQYTSEVKRDFEKYKKKYEENRKLLESLSIRNLSEDEFKNNISKSIFKNFINKIKSMILMHDETLELENVDKFTIFIVKEIINKYKKLTEENKEK